MTQINIPSITVDTPIPYIVKLRDKGQALEGLYIRGYQALAYLKVTERHARWSGGVGQLLGYTVTTVGLSPQTRREKEFMLRERADMVKFVNAWIAKIGRAHV